MTVVRNEYEMGENKPISVMLKRMQSVLYDWHAYGRSTIGARSDIENVPIENLQAFYRKWYQPDNAVLTVSGKFDEAKVLEWIQETFGKIKRPERVLPKAWTIEPVADGPRSLSQWDTACPRLWPKTPMRWKPPPTFWPTLRADVFIRRLWKPVWPRKFSAGPCPRVIRAS